MIINQQQQTEITEVFSKLPANLQAVIQNTSVNFTGTPPGGGSFLGSGVILGSDDQKVTLLTAKHNLYSFNGMVDPPAWSNDLVTRFQSVTINYGAGMQLSTSPNRTAPITSILPVTTDGQPSWLYDGRMALKPILKRLASNGFRAIARGTCIRGYALGRRFTTRGSTRSGRSPTRCDAIARNAAATSPAAGSPARPAQLAPERLQHLPRPLEAQLPRRHSVPPRRLGHHPADQVVRQQVGPDLLADHRRRLAPQHVHLHRLLDGCGCPIPHASDPR